MRLCGIWLVVLGVVLAAAGPARAASFTVTEWSLGTGVVGAPGSDWDVSTVVQNNFQENHYASAFNSTAASTFDFAWNDNFGRFLIEGTHQAEDVGAVAKSSGLIYFYANEPLAYDIDISYTYDLPGGALEAGFTIALVEDETHEVHLSGSYHEDTWTAGPVTGTLGIQDSGVLPANRLYWLQYSLELISYGNSGALGTGSGHVDLTLTAVPEPASLAPLALLLLVARRRRNG